MCKQTHCTSRVVSPLHHVRGRVADICMIGHAHERAYSLILDVCTNCVNEVCPLSLYLSFVCALSCFRFPALLYSYMSIPFLFYHHYSSRPLSSNQILPILHLGSTPTGSNAAATGSNSHNPPCSDYSPSYYHTLLHRAVSLHHGPQFLPSSPLASVLVQFCMGRRETAVVVWGGLDRVRRRRWAAGVQVGGWCRCCRRTSCVRTRTRMGALGMGMVGCFEPQRAGAKMHWLAMRWAIAVGGTWVDCLGFRLRAVVTRNAVCCRLVSLCRCIP
jgi:hypothetical protein